LATPDWVQRLQLAPHPEGGWFRRVHTAERRVQTRYGERAAASSIHYLLDRAAPVSRLHRNRSTILHYLQSGGPVEYLTLDQAGVLRREVLGPGAAIFLDVPGGIWKASHLLDGADHALVSEAVIPGWQIEDHEFLSREQLARDYPQHEAALAAFIR
jgi:predicted cupin superfamily sugar epimerase